MLKAISQITKIDFSNSKTYILSQSLPGTQTFTADFFFFNLFICKLYVSTCKIKILLRLSHPQLPHTPSQSLLCIDLRISFQHFSVHLFTYICTNRNMYYGLLGLREKYIHIQENLISCLLKVIDYCLKLMYLCWWMNIHTSMWCNRQDSSQ